MDYRSLAEGGDGAEVVGETDVGSGSAVVSSGYRDTAGCGVIHSKAAKAGERSKGQWAREHIRKIRMEVRVVGLFLRSMTFTYTYRRA